MIMSWIWTGLVCISIVCSLVGGRGPRLAEAVFSGAQTGVSLAISLTGSICLWSGVGCLMSHIGLTGSLARFLGPFIHRVFPDSKTDPQLAGSLSANICANLLGLGNAATPMGIDAAKRLKNPDRPSLATDQLCRLIVLNTASIQLIPANVVAVRLSLGCTTPLDILPAVWITSFSSAGFGLLAAVFLGRMWKK